MVDIWSKCEKTAVEWMDNAISIQQILSELIAFKFDDLLRFSV